MFLLGLKSYETGIAHNPRRKDCTLLEYCRHGTGCIHFPLWQECIQFAHRSLWQKCTHFARLIVGRYIAVWLTIVWYR